MALTPESCSSLEDGRMSARPRRSKLTAKRVRELFDCDPIAGTLTWRPRPGHPVFNARWAGRHAGEFDPDYGYVRITIDGKRYLAHRLIWLHVHGWLPGLIDHRDGHGFNCTLTNLRPASHSQNGMNSRTRRKSSRGCWREPRTGLWQVRLNANGQRIWIGRFGTEEAAKRAYEEAAAELHGEFSFTARPAGEPCAGRAA
jgi:hypothetical protein